MKYLLSLVLIFLLTNISYAEYSVLYFGASWCQYCVKMKPSWEDKEVRQVLRDKNISLFRIDTDKKKDLAEEYGVSGLPTTIIVELNDEKKGVVKSKKSGYMDGKQLAEFIRNNTK